jgi:hypothetical protein
MLQRREQIKSRGGGARKKVLLFISSIFRKDKKKKSKRKTNKFKSPKSYSWRVGRVRVERVKRVCTVLPKLSFLTLIFTKTLPVSEIVGFAYMKMSGEGGGS